MKKKTTQIDDVETDAVDAILAVENAMMRRLINRKQHIRALLLAVIAKKNILFDGPPGTAKTMTGSLFASAITGDFVFFKTQMLKSSLPEQLFGPLNMKMLRADCPVYEYYTKNMLPKAHLAIIEEVYRASEMVLSSMLTILNERKFHNGGRLEECPLMCAIGTTNFTAKGEEIEAFNDRWLIHMKVDPLQSMAQRREMYNRASNRAEEESPLEAGLTFNQLLELQAKCREVKIPSIVLDLYERIVSGMMSDSAFPLTERRQMQVLDLIRACAILNNRSEASQDDLIAAEFGLTLVGDAKSGAQFANVFTSVVGNYQRIQQEEIECNQLQDRLDRYVSVFDPKMEAERAAKLQEACRKMVDVMSRRPNTYYNQSLEDKFQQILSRTRDLLRDVTDVVNQTINQ